MLRHYPTSRQNFESIITGNYVYVDKTLYMYELVQETDFLFFARPRRFGKSMMISTMKAIYQGKKHLFKDLWIYDKLDWETVSRPVIYLDFTRVEYQLTVASLETGLAYNLDQIAQEYDLILKAENAKSKLVELLQHFHTQGKNAVLLIDEYDMPITDALDSPHFNEISIFLGSFYGTLKGYGEWIHQALLTGVSKFGKVSLFSKLNNLTDISMEEKYMKMCGFSQEELEKYFSEDVAAVANSLKMSEKKTWQKIKEQYNGYSWNGVDKLYCPFLVMKFFRHQKFGDYWFETGTPTILLKMLRKEALLPFEMEEMESSEGLLSNMDAHSIDIVALLFQTGYLTIKKIRIKEGEPTYYLSYPNNEVRNAFQKHILANYLEVKEGNIDRNYISKLRNALLNNDVDRFIKICQMAFSSIAYQQIANSDEDSFHSIMHLLVKLTGERIISEVPHNVGRADSFIFMEHRTFILEYKFNGTAVAALAQIIDKKYAQPFENEGLPFTFIGINYNSEVRNIDSWKSISTDSSSNLFS